MKNALKRIATAALSAATLASAFVFSTTVSANSLSIALQDQMRQSERAVDLSPEVLLNA